MKQIGRSNAYTLSSLVLGFCQLIFLFPGCTSFQVLPRQQVFGFCSAERHGYTPHASWALPSSQQPSDTDTDTDTDIVDADTAAVDKNTAYVKGLLNNLTEALDKYIVTGSPPARTSIYNLLKQVEREAHDNDLVAQAKRNIRRAGLPLPTESAEKELGKNDAENRRTEVDARKNWERIRTQDTGGRVSEATASAAGGEGRSALSSRSGSKPDLLMQNMDRRLDTKSVSEDKADLERMMNDSETRLDDISDAREVIRIKEANIAASTKISELVAKAGSGDAFEGERLGIGGLDDVLAQVKRRVWTPLAAPPQLLSELGIHPVRGLLMYGRPGCGKTLMARTIGDILSPARPITVVAGPAIMDKFVGSSEKNLREIFDNPPDIYEKYREGELDGGESVADNALHVVIMDEFDAIARTRGGRGSGGGQGDAGVARDSLVNQMLTCLDGIEPPVVPTFVIGLTNKRSLIDPALLRPGRFEVQLEVPPPRSNKQRISILKVHMKNMNLAGRLLVKDAPMGTAAARHVEKSGGDGVPTYEELLADLAEQCDGMSGASLAGVARAAASHALERVVEEYSTAIADNADSSTKMMDCLVTKADFEDAILDVNESSGETDWELTEEEKEGEKKEDDTEAKEEDDDSSDETETENVNGD